MFLIVTEDELLTKLEQWLADRSDPPTILEVVETRDSELLAAFILKGFRVAARQAVVDRLEREAASTFASDRSVITAAVFRVFDGLAGAWSLEDGEKLQLLGLHDPVQLQDLRAAPLDQVPTEIIERVVILLDIFKAVNTLLPQPNGADAWIRSSNTASMFGGQSALDVMIGRGLEGLREVRAYLNAQIWAG